MMKGDRKRYWYLRALAALFMALILTAGPGLAADMGDTMGPMDDKPEAMKAMQMMAPADAPAVPAVTGYSEGERILFLHTEASDQKIAQLLTDMMGSPVLVVPALADAPDAMLAKVYVFTNGVVPEGPRGPLEHQPDVFDNPPGRPGYSPLRKVVLVTWSDAAEAHLLTSAAAVEEELKNGALSSEKTGIVVNMPLLTWPGGTR
jgi:hypothetical protein